MAFMEELVGDGCLLSMVFGLSKNEHVRIADFFLPCSGIISLGIIAPQVLLFPDVPARQKPDRLFSERVRDFDTNRESLTNVNFRRSNWPGTETLRKVG